MTPLFAALVLAQAAAPGAERATIDAERAAWQFRRPVNVIGGASLVSLVLPPELSEKAAPGHRDLRLVDETGREVSYLLDWTSEREGLATWQVDVKDVRREQEEAREDSAIRSQWTLDLGEARTFTDLALRLPDVSFAWHLRVEASTDGRGYEVIERDAALFDQTWNNERVRQTGVRFEAPVTARYLRLTARSAASSRMMRIEGASVTQRRRLKGDAWSRNVAATPVAKGEGEQTRSTRYALDVSSRLPFDEVEIVSDDAAFSRRVRLVEEGGSGRQAGVVLGEGSVYRLRASDTLMAGETIRFRARSGNGGALHLEVDDAGSPPLRGLRVRLHGARVRLVFPAPGGNLTLYYGNQGTRAAAYDLEGLRPRLTQISTGEAVVLDEELNPAFRRDPPLRFAATLGASLDPAGWRRERPITALPEEDVYALTLNAADLAFLRPDLADLRVVNEKNLQVPFLIDGDFADERVPLAVERVEGSSGRSAYRLRLAGPFEGDGPPVSKLEIEIGDSFFERRARLRHPRSDSRREPPFSLSLSRKPPAKDPIVLAASVPLGEMTLEVDDGDNAPLEIRAATAVVRVPRVVFKAAPGNLRVLLGNRAAAAPRYDIAGLRSELLAYSAIPARAGALALNKGSTGSWRDVFESAPRSAVVWGAILIALVALVGLTVRTIRNT